jgi:uncharacterized protein YutE (UPF0331/DUF86 family)
LAELLLRKAILVRDRIAKVKAALPVRAEDVASDERLEAYISFHLFLLIQDSIDLAAHLVAARGLAVPGSQRELFEALSGAKLVSRESALAMAQMASLRNRIAHSYGDLDPVRMVREAPTGLAHVERFLAELSSLLADQGA